MHCTECGAEQKAEGKYCHNCGSKHHKKAFSLGRLAIVLLILVPIFVVIFLRVIPEKDKTLVKENLPKVFSSQEADVFIRSFFNLLDRRDYEKAFSQFSDKKRAVIKFTDWKNGYKNTISHVVNENKCANFTCEVFVTATENTATNLRRADYRFKYYLVFDDIQNLKIDDALLVSHKITEILNSYSPGANQDKEMINSFVKIVCMGNNYETLSQGSGSIINTDVVMTNMHVSEGDFKNCLVGKIDERGLPSGDVYTVDYSIVENPIYDFATFHIKRSPENTGANPRPLPLSPCSEKQVQLGDAVRIYGFPSASGGGLTITDGLLSGFGDASRGLLITSAKIDHGSSGGGAIDFTKQCFLGIPTIAYQGEIESYGAVLSINKILAVQSNLLSLDEPIASPMGSIDNVSYPGYSISVNVDIHDKNVELIQAQLNTLGYNLIVDGYFGDITSQAVQSFQAAGGLSSTGVVDEETWNTLFSK